MNRRTLLALAPVALMTLALPARNASARVPARRFIADLTWIELRDAVAAGAVVAILPTGGSEANGPHMAIGKHNLIVRHCAGAIARRLGNALVAPVLTYVPEGGFDPPDGNMGFPGTLGVSDETFAAILRDGAHSLALAGFHLICFIGDHGQSQAVQTSVAAQLSHLWRGRGIRVANLDRYYSGNGEEAWLKAQGFTAAEIGVHAGLIDTAELMAVAPGAVRKDLLSPLRWPAGPTGAAGDPTRANAALGAKLLELKIAAAVAQAREILGAKPSSHD